METERLQKLKKKKEKYIYIFMIKKKDLFEPEEDHYKPIRGTLQVKTHGGMKLVLA